MPSLEDKRAMIMRRYSDMFVGCSDYEVQQIYGRLSLFLAKCDGLISPAEAQKLESAFNRTATFSPYITPVDRKEKIVTTLKFLKKHHINRPTEIIRILTQALLAYEKVEASFRKYLVEFTDNPGKPFRWYAGRLSVSVSSVTRAYQKLRKAIHLRFFACADYPMFKLKHFILYFKPDRSFRTSMVSKRVFTRTLNYDTFGEWMWASFLVPDQDRILKEFKNSLAIFASEVLLQVSSS